MPLEWNLKFEILEEYDAWEIVLDLGQQLQKKYHLFSSLRNLLFFIIFFFESAYFRKPLPLESNRSFVSHCPILFPTTCFLTRTH